MGDEFLEIKRKKERGLSNKEFLEKVSEAMKDEIITWRTTDSSLLAIGLVETAKKSIMREQEE